MTMNGIAGALLQSAGWHQTTTGWQHPGRPGESYLDPRAVVWALEQNAGETDEGGRMNGTVKRHMREKGFGFIKGDDGVDYFFHISDVKAEAGFRFDSITEGQAVEFEPTDGAKGPRATDVTRA